MIASTDKPVLAVRGLAKAFGGEPALAGVDLTVAAGQIHALLGPNGSGKSTLIGCLSGRLAPDEGTMRIGERIYRRFDPRGAFGVGTAVIYQHFSLVPPLSVADNVFLGAEITHEGRIDHRAQRREAQRLLARLGSSIDPRTPVKRLSVGQQQLVEIAKALRHMPQLLVLDEPTAALGEREARLLGQQVRHLADGGLGILYVTHLLSEVFEIADYVTVLRDGRSVLSSPLADVTPSRVIAAISPRGVAARPHRRKPAAAREAPLLELADVEVEDVGPIDLAVQPAQVVAVFGLLGSGRTELLEAIYGIRRRDRGTVAIDGRPVQPHSPAQALRNGIALVAAERIRQSMFPTMTALDNVLLPHMAKLARGLLRDRRRERREFAATAELLSLRPSTPSAPAWTLSGGNQQKLAVGRWLASASGARLLLLDEPTQGIDVGARADLYHLIRAFAHEGRRAILFTSSDPEEVEALADEAVVLARGRIAGRLGAEEITTSTLLELAHGATRAAAT